MDVNDQQEQSEKIQDAKNSQNEDFVIFELSRPSTTQLQHDQ